MDEPSQPTPRGDAEPGTTPDAPAMVAPAVATGPALWQSPAVASIARVTAALRSLPVAARVDEVFRTAMAAVSPGPGERCVIWHVSTDGTRMRAVPAPGATQTGWAPATGPVAQVLGARRPIEMGIVDEELLRGVQDAPLGRIDAGDDARRPNRAFGRFLPLFSGSRIIGVLGIVRAAGRPVFDLDDRALIDVLAERLEVGLRLDALRDELAGERSRGLVHAHGLMMGDDLLARLGAISGDIVFRHLFGRGTDYMSPGVTSSLGFTPDEVMSDPGLIDRLLHPDDRHLLTDLVTDPGGAARPLLIRVMKRDGNLSWQLIRVIPIRDDRGIVLGIEGLATDVTVMKRAEAELAHQARSDSLTGLANRLNFRESLSRSLARIERHHGMMGVLFLDLDGFKKINDTFGHAAGDAVLQQVADRLRRVIRREDLVARLGGDEFAVLLVEVSDESEASATAHRILEALERPIMLGDKQADVSTGIGISVTRTGTISPDELINRADIALYQAKRSGRGRWQIYEGASGAADPRADGSAAGFLGTSSVAASSSAPTPNGPRLRVDEVGLRAALAAEEFRVHYAPEVDASTGAVVGVEAVLLWQHPDLGLLTEDAFLAELTAGEALHPLGEWLLRESARQVAAWHQQFERPLRLWVKASVAQLAQPGYADTTLATMAAVGLAPRHVVIDIAEDSLAALDPHGEAATSALHRSGLRIAVGSFGTGSASLRTLRKLPLSFIRLDASIVNGPENSDLAAMAVKLAESIGAEVVATGVTRVEQATHLRTLTCTYLQGPLVGTARPADDMTAVLAIGIITLPSA